MFISNKQANKQKTQIIKAPVQSWSRSPHPQVRNGSGSVKIRSLFRTYDTLIFGRVTTPGSCDHWTWASLLPGRVRGGMSRCAVPSPYRSSREAQRLGAQGLGPGRAQFLSEICHLPAGNRQEGGLRGCEPPGATSCSLSSTALTPLAGTHSTGVRWVSGQVTKWIYLLSRRSILHTLDMEMTIPTSGFRKLNDNDYLSLSTVLATQSLITTQ